MDLLSAIPGLDIHATAPVVALRTFDRVKAMRDMADSAARVDGELTAAGVAWLKAERPEVWAHLREATLALDEAYEREDLGAFFQALCVWEAYHIKAGKLFAARPPVIDIQEELF